MERMNKDSYIAILRKKLYGISESEIEDAIVYVEEYFEEAGEGNESSVWNDLGSPSKFAATIKADAVSKAAEANGYRNKTKSGFGSVVTIFLGICALPIALPLVLVIVALMFAFLCVIIAFAIAGFAGILGSMIAGLPLLFRGISLFDTPANALISVGGGLLILGVGMFISIGSYYLIRYTIPFFKKQIITIYRRLKKKGEQSYE